jgi:microcystin-dependent protein
MTLSVKHTFQSAKGDTPDVTLVQPSNWNAEHTLTCATDRLLGRTTAATGVVEEIPISDYMQSLLNVADLAALLAAAGFGAFTTGDVKLTMKTSADAGWVMCNDGTIGSATSGATFASASASSLYTLIWTNVSNTYAPVTGGRGASAAADFAANKPMALTKMLGRALAIAGAGSGLTSRALGEILGAETHVLTTAQIPAHAHGVTDPGHAHQINVKVHTNVPIGGANTAVDGAVPWGDPSYPNAGISNSNTTGISIQNEGGGTSHPNMQPSSFLNAMIKL